MKPKVKQRYWFMIVVSILLSVSGIVIAGGAGAPVHGGDGGALAVAVSFFILFLRRSLGEEAQQLIIEGVKWEDVANYTTTITSIMSRLNIEASGLKKQSFALAWASGVGTLAWGFGVYAAQALVSHGFDQWVSHLFHG
jgi:hypothetical protein